MDKFSVEVQPEHDCMVHVPFFVYVNGEKYFGESWYSIDLNSYLSALEFSESAVKFIGSCGVYGCCGTDMWTRATAECWSWFDIVDDKWQERHFAWSDVYEATKYMIEKNQCISEGSDPADEYYDHFPDYRHKLEFLKSMMDGSAVTLSVDPNIKTSIEEYKEKHFPTRAKLPAAADVIDSIKTADLVMVLSATDKVDIGISRMVQNKRQSVLQTQNQLYQFLLDGLEKDLLTVCLEESGDEEVCLNPPPDRLGYGRFVICRGSAEEVFEIRKAAAQDTQEQRAEFKSIRYVLCNALMDKFDIGIGHPPQWNPTIHEYDTSDGKCLWLTEEELLSFLQQDTHRGTVLFCVPYDVDHSDELKRIAEQSGFPKVKYGKGAIPLNKR